jgi:mannose-6-phosphate isomerase
MLQAMMISTPAASLPLPARPLRPVAVLSMRPWAGSRLGGGVGEHWVAGPGSAVTLADGRSVTLDDLAADAGAALVGTRGVALLGQRFPLLVKLIDAGDWLSLQVHPSDAIARRLAGPDAVGKAEAWLVLDANPDAHLVVGPRAGIAADVVRAGILAGTLDRPDCEAVAARPGDVYNVEPGTIHAIGAGVFVYEIEQPSDLTYRISDWGRPAVPGRSLHRAEALEAVRPELQARLAGSDWQLDGGSLTAPEFRLELIAPGSAAAARLPGGATPEIVTVVRGDVALEGDGWTEQLGLHETAVVPACVGSYRIGGNPGSLAAVGSLP